MKVFGDILRCKGLVINQTSIDQVSTQGMIKKEKESKQLKI